ncbi:MAG: sigma-70 family RNA polymerase sigma factor [Deltaproteobacteria bacterium]|nr:sigma-70 family RNA polymerase sigma factor [Deltaproteobacteria bacterium]
MVERTPRTELEQAYRLHGGAVFARCRYLLRSEDAAKDATQEVFVRAVTHWDSFRGDASPSTWLLRIATNHCLHLLESQRAGWRERFRRFSEHADEVKAHDAAPSDTREDVRRVLSRFDAETQAIAIHYFVDEMTQAEIGALLGRSLPTVRKRLENFTRIAKKELGRDLG